MAKLVELGRGPVNASEREIVARLVRDLPGRAYTVIPNATLPDPRTGHGYEYDVIVVTPHAVYAVEVKGWDGEVRALSRADWQLDSGTVVQNPLPLIDNKSRVLATLIKGARLRVERLPYVHGCLVSGFDTTRYDVFSADQDRCLPLLRCTPRDAARCTQRDVACPPSGRREATVPFRAHPYVRGVGTVDDWGWLEEKMGGMSPMSC